MRVITVARKPLSEGTVAQNLIKWGTGALNIDACRIESGCDYVNCRVTQGISSAPTSYDPRQERRVFEPAAGRWPANLILCHPMGTGGRFFKIIPGGDNGKI